MEKKIKIFNHNIRIPKSFYEGLGLKDGDSLFCSAKEDCIVLCKHSKDSKIKKIFGNKEEWVNKLNNANLQILHIQDEESKEYVALLIENTEYINEICGVVEEPLINFGGKYTTNGGTLVFKQGFLFNNIEKARAAASKIIRFYKSLYETME